MSSETELSARIAEVFERIGCIVVRIQSGTIPLRGRYLHCAEPGTPDRIVLGAGGAVRFIEIKRPGQKLRPEQIKWRERAQRLGHIVDVVTSVSEAMAIARELAGGRREH